MVFVFRNWKKFLSELRKEGYQSFSCSSAEKDKKQIFLKHDVETNVKKAYKIAKIEKSFGHIGSYYVQAYLLKKARNIKLLKKMKEMGHEVSYHYDVLDEAKGDMQLADKKFSENLKLFQSLGFEIKTVCQHGNPLIERKGYTSNRDFFRNQNIAKKYNSISDIMVNYKASFSIEYDYISDAGREFKLIFDPLFNDKIDSSDRNKIFKNLNEVLKSIKNNKVSIIISIHPHRWCATTFGYLGKKVIFNVVRFVAKVLYKIPIFKKLFSRFYYLAKKI